MSDLISRQAAIKVLERKKDKNAKGDIGGFYNKIIQNDIDALKALPSAQPDIIACADCKHWICHDRRCGFWNHGVKPLDWCCHAERRTDADAKI